MRTAIGMCLMTGVLLCASSSHAQQVKKSTVSGVAFRTTNTCSAGTTCGIQPPFTTSGLALVTKACTTGPAFIKLQNGDRLIQDGTCTDYHPGVPVFDTDTLTCDNTSGSGSNFCMLIGVETKK